MRLHLFIFAIVFFPLACRAGGSVNFEQIEPLLKQKPQLSSFLLQSFVMPDSAYAQIRLGPRFQHLGAYRIGPYSFRAQPKNGSTVLVTLCTQYQFLDGSGKVIQSGTDQEFKATQVKEELTAVVIREVIAEESGSGCP